MMTGEALDEVRGALADHGISRRRRLRVVGRVHHVLSHRRLTVEVAAGHATKRWALPEAPPAPYIALAWCRRDEVALSTLARKVLELVEESSRQEVLW